MGAILPFLKDRAVFEPEITHAMSVAFDEVCQALNLTAGLEREREVIAVRIIELARRGEHDPQRLRDRLLHEANGGTPA